MIQAIGHRRSRRASRRATAVLLAFLVNLALVPCTMAIEVVEEGHGCCPPEMKYEAQECCELDDVSVDTRGGPHENDLLPDLDVVFAGAPTVLPASSPTRFAASSDPPDPPDLPVVLHRLLCVYLK